jgi:hypothetical protein
MKLYNITIPVHSYPEHRLPEDTTVDCKQLHIFILIYALLLFSLYLPTRGYSASAGDPNSTGQVPDPNTIQNLLKIVDSVFFLDPNGIMDSVDESLALPEHSDENPPQGADMPIWQFTYHPQVNSKHFNVLKYPYYPGGRDYANPSFSTATELPARSASSGDGEQHGSFSAITREVPSVLQDLSTVSSLVYRWRLINESPGTLLEVIHAVELSKTSTDIYRSQSDLAIAVKRTLGHIGILNQKFDLLSRMATESIVRSENTSPLISRLKKQLTDLEILLRVLTEQNDSIRIALGLDKIDRSIDTSNEYEQVDYAKQRLPLVSL